MGLDKWDLKISVDVHTRIRAAGCALWSSYELCCISLSFLFFLHNLYIVMGYSLVWSISPRWCLFKCVLLTKFYIYDLLMNQCRHVCYVIYFYHFHFFTWFICRYESMLTYMLWLFFNYLYFCSFRICCYESMLAYM